MYNAEDKQKYIKFKESQATLPANYLERLFTNTQEVEYSLSCDVSDWHETEIIEHYKNEHSSSLHSLIVMNGRLAEYVDFLNRTGKIQHKNRFNNITTDMLESCVDEEKTKKKFLSRKEFYAALNLLDNAVDKFVLTSLYEGIKGKGFDEIWRLELKNITPQTAILHNNRQIDLMDSKLYHLAHESADTDFYYSYGKTDVTYRMYGAKDQIIKMTSIKQFLEISDDPVMIERQNKNIFRKFERAVCEIGWDEVKPRSLLISGQIEYANRLAEKKGYDISELINNKQEFDYLQKRFTKIASKDEFIKIAKYIDEQTTSSG